MVTLATVALFAFALVAVDGSILATTRTQLRNGAEAAARAAAVEWARTGDEDSAKQAAIDFASFNVAVREGLEPIRIAPADIEILPGAGAHGEDRVRARTHRTEAHGDPLRTYFLRLLDLAYPRTADVEAVATAEIHSVCRTACVKPWAIADRWEDEDGDGVYDPGEPYHPVRTGYAAPQDIGAALAVGPARPGDEVAFGRFFPVELPPLREETRAGVGGEEYRTGPDACAPYLVGPGDTLALEPGLLVDAWENLLDRDPVVRWDEGGGPRVGSRSHRSPRMVLVPVFDPASYADSEGRLVVVSKVAALFLEGPSSGDRVRGRFMRVAAGGTPCDGPNVASSFLFGIHLVE